MAIAGPPLIHEDRVVLIATTRVNPEVHHLGVRLAGAAGQVEDGSLIRMWATSGDHHDLQGQRAALTGPAVLEYVIDAAAQLVLHVIDVARRQSHARLGWTRHRRLSTGE
jgi:hypothetical protein